MFNIDLHVHTQRYSPCAEFMDPYSLSGITRQYGLHGVLLAEHDAVWSSREVVALQRRLRDLKVYRGCEVSTAEGHIVVVGIKTMRGIKPGMQIGKLLDIIERRGGASVLVHPYRPSGNGGFMDLHDLPPEISAVEVMSNATDSRTEALARQLANRYGLPMVAGSDAHAVDQVGIVHTSFSQMPRNERELARAICEGKGRPRRVRISSYTKPGTSIQ